MSTIFWVMVKPRPETETRDSVRPETQDPGLKMRNKNKDFFIRTTLIYPYY